MGEGKVKPRGWLHHQIPRGIGQGQRFRQQTTPKLACSSERHDYSASGIEQYQYYQGTFVKRTLVLHKAKSAK